VLFGESGRDATEAFEDVGHSDEAREILAKYLVGTCNEVSIVHFVRIYRYTHPETLPLRNTER
jgi:cytochrome b involved in lipid metabolism